MTDVFVSELPKTLSDEETINYFQEYEKGSLTAREKLIFHNIRIVVKRANHFVSLIGDAKWDFKEELLKELVAIGNEHLIHAVDTFKLSFGIRFVSYAAVCIDNGIRAYFEENKKYRYLVSFDDPIGCEDGRIYRDTIPDSLTDLAEDYAEREDAKMLYDLMRSFVICLPDKKGLMLKYYFGLFGYPRYNTREIGNMLGVTRACVSKIIKNSLESFRNKMAFLRLNPTFPIEKPIPIYEVLHDYRRLEVDAILSSLNAEDHQLVKLKYGKDLDDPVTSPLWNEVTEERFNNSFLPKIKEELDTKRERWMMSQIDSIPKNDIIWNTSSVSR